MRMLVTGGAGFIGSAVLRSVAENTDRAVFNTDKLTCAGELASLAEVEAHPRFFFKKVDTCDQDAIQRIFKKHRPDAVMHLAARFGVVIREWYNAMELYIDEVLVAR